MSQSIPRVFATIPAMATAGTEQLSVVPKQPSPSADVHSSESGAMVAMEPELRAIGSAEGVKPWSTMDLVVSMDAVKLHLYDQDATSEDNRKEHGISRFALNGSTLRYKMLSSGASEAQVVLKSFTMSNTRPGNTVFREIIPAAGHDRNQFMVLFTTSGRLDDAALAIVTVDAPDIIFSMDPVFALINFFATPLPPPRQADAPVQATSQAASEPSSAPGLNFRVDLHDVSVRVLEDDTRADTRAISLSIKQILVSQQVFCRKFTAVAVC
jgi:vacuolar protein sorting-associated protein 13A/C